MNCFQQSTLQSFSNKHFKYILFQKHLDVKVLNIMLDDPEFSEKRSLEQDKLVFQRIKIAVI